MAKVDLPWFRYYSETTDDFKVFRIAQELNLPKYAVVGAWSTVLCLAAKSPLRGALYITTEKRYTLADISVSLGADQTTTQLFLAKFLEYQMLELVDEAYLVKNWEKRQFESDYSTPRVHRYRDKQRNVSDETPCNVSLKRTRNGPDTDTDTDTDTEAEAEVESPASSPSAPSVLASDAHPETSEQSVFSYPISNRQSAISIPSNPAEASLDPFMAILITATGAYPPQAEYKNCIDTIRLLLKLHPDRAELIDYLKRFWIAWKGRKSKNGNAYKSGNMAWLYEWAVNGEIPPESHPLISSEDKLSRQQKALYGR